MTGEQISALKVLIDEGVAPYIDFSIFGPHGIRIIKKMFGDYPPKPISPDLYCS